MSDFINVTNEVAKATIAAEGSAELHAGKSLLADGIVYESDGVNWDPVTIGDFTASNLTASDLVAGTSILVDGDLVVKDATGIKQITSNGKIVAEAISVPKRNRAAWRHFSPQEQLIGNTANSSYQMICDVPKDTIGVQVVLSNSTSSAIASSLGIKVSCAPTETATNLQGPVIGGSLNTAFVQATWSGAANPTIPAAPVSGDNNSKVVVTGITTSDVIPFKFTPAIDAGLNGKGLAMFRFYANLGGYPYANMTSEINSAFPSVAGDRVTKLSNLGTGDYTAANPASAPTLGELKLIDGLIFHTLTKSYLILSGGDSIMAGNASGTADGHPAKLALLLRADGKNVQNFNGARGNLNSTAYFARLKNYIAGGVVPTHVMFPIHSRNDNGGTASPTEAQVTGRIAAAAEFASYVNSIGAIPLIVGPTPESSPSAAFQAAVPRLEDAGAKIAAAFGGVYTSVIGALGNADYSWKGGMSSDGIHPNDAGYTVIAELTHASTKNIFS